MTSADTFIALKTGILGFQHSLESPMPGLGPICPLLRHNAVCLFIFRTLSFRKSLKQCIKTVKKELKVEWNKNEGRNSLTEKQEQALPSTRGRSVSQWPTAWLAVCTKGKAGHRHSAQKTERKPAAAGGWRHFQQVCLLTNRVAASFTVFHI